MSVITESMYGAGRIRNWAIVGVAILLCQLIGRAEVSEPDTPPPMAFGGGTWQLGPELISNGTFEADALGSVPATWTKTGLGACEVTNNSPYGGSQLMRIGSAAGWVSVQTTYTIPTASNRYYRYEVYWRQNTNVWGPNFRIGVLVDPLISLSWPNGVKVVNGVTNDATGETNSPWFEAPWPPPITEMINGREPAWRGYFYDTNWLSWRGTIEVLPSITNFNNQLRPTFLALDGYDYGVDNISLKEWIPVPSAGTIFIVR